MFVIVSVCEAEVERIFVSGIEGVEAEKTGSASVIFETLPVPWFATYKFPAESLTNARGSVPAVR